MLPLFIKCSDIQILRACSSATAWREMQYLKDVFGKEKHQRITFKEYAEYYGITMEDIITTLSRKKSVA